MSEIFETAFLEFSKFKILTIFQIEIFWNFLSSDYSQFWQFSYLPFDINQISYSSKFSKLETFGIYQSRHFWKFLNCKFLKFSKSQFWNFPSSHYSQLCQFLYLPFDINQISQFLKFSKLEIFGIFLNCKFSKLQFWNFSSSHYSQIFPIFIFALWYKSNFLIFEIFQTANFWNLPI